MYQRSSRSHTVQSPDEVCRSHTVQSPDEVCRSHTVLNVAEATQAHAKTAAISLRSSMRAQNPRSTRETLDYWIVSRFCSAITGILLLVTLSYPSIVLSKWKRTCTEIYGALRRSAHICTNKWKLLTAASDPEGTRKSARISENVIAMKIGPFVSFSKWPEELGSIGCVFIARSLPFVRLIPGANFFQNCKLNISHRSWAFFF